METLGDTATSKTSQNEPHGEKYICVNCSKEYSSRNGLWKHKSKCNNTQEINTLDEPSDNQLIMMLIKENSELRKEQTDVCQKIQPISNRVNSHNINSNNKTFNINVFLNETCKDAINLTDFVNQITLSLEDLEETSKVGYAEGISNVFIRNLKDIDYKERPIHCNDFKREVLYIKDDNQWVKDNKEKLTNAIKIVANKNIKQIPNWQKANPDYNNPKSKQNDKYMKMLCEVMSGSSKEEQQKNYNKIIKNISKEVMIDKDKFSS